MPVSEQSNKFDGKDFDDFINQEWKSQNPIPGDQTRWGTFDIMIENNRKTLNQICEQDQGLVGQLYRSMLEQPDQPSAQVADLLTKISSQVTSHSGYWQMSAKLLECGVSSLFHVCKGEDDKQPEWQVPHILQSGLGLLDCSYYTEREDLHQPYKNYIQELGRLYGLELDAEAIFKFEQAKAKLHLTRTEARNSEAVYNQTTWAKLSAYCPEYFKQTSFAYDSSRHSTEAPQYVVVQNPKLMSELKELVESTPADTLRDLLLFQTANHFAGYQPQAINDLKFDFYGRQMNGQTDQDEPWKRALGKVESMIGDELGKLYVAKYFTKERQQVCNQMIELLVDAMCHTLHQSKWMSAATKEAALTKLSTFSRKVGVPKKYHSIEGLWQESMPEHPADKALSWSRWDWRYQELDQFYTKVDQDLWHMTPQTINAYYNPTQNEIVFPAGILQPPFFGMDQMELNLGAMGVIIGHEMTHGFDDQGRKYNHVGVMEDWWTKEDWDRFDQLAAVVRDQFSSLQVFGKSVNGQLTLGENIADIGGLKLALTALENYYGDRLTPAHYDRFFRSYANVWCLNIRKEFAYKLLAMDPHSPAKIRVNGALPHIDQWYTTYDVTKESPMYLEPDERMSIW